MLTERIYFSSSSPYIYATKIDTFVCPPDISQTVAVRIMKLAHRPRIASTTNKLISEPILLSVLSMLFKTIKRIGAALATRSANRRRHLIRPTPFPVSITQPRRRPGKMLSLKTALCDYPDWMTETGATVRVKPFSQSYPRSAWTVSEANHTVPSDTSKTSLLYAYTMYPLLTRCQRHVPQVSGWFTPNSPLFNELG